MALDNAVSEMDDQTAELFLSSMVEEHRNRLIPLSRAFYTRMGTLGFVTRMYSFAGVSEPGMWFRLRPPFQVIMLPEQTIKLYQSFYDMNDDHIQITLPDWQIQIIKTDVKLTSAGFKNSYYLCFSPEANDFEECNEEPKIKFVYTPKVEQLLWKNMLAIDDFYFRSISSKISGYNFEKSEFPQTDGKPLLRS